MDDRFNTAAGWVLAAGIVALGSSIVSGMYFHADSAEHPEEPGYFIEGAAEEGGADAGPDLGTLLASADAAAGEKVFASAPRVTRSTRAAPTASARTFMA